MERASMEHVRRNLSLEMRNKLISLRNYSGLTWAEIAAQCGCNVSWIVLLFFVIQNASDSFQNYQGTFIAGNNGASLVDST